MRTSLFLKTTTELLSDVKARLSDTGNALGTDAQYYAALSEGVRMWAGRVFVPRLYTLSDGFSVGTYDYVLPAYVRPPFRVQIRASTYTYLGLLLPSEENNHTWHDLAGWEVEPAADGTYKLRLPVPTYTDEGRIIWYAENGPLPATAPTLTSAIDADDTTITLTVTGGPDLAASGFFKIDSEWVSYDNLSRTSSTSYTVSGCLRGLYGTTAASHSEAATVLWGVATDDQRVWVQLWDYVTAYVHGLQMHKGTTEDVSRHEKLMSFYSQRAENWWRQNGYVSQRGTRLRVTAGAVGPMLW